MEHGYSTGDFHLATLPQYATKGVKLTVSRNGNVAILPAIQLSHTVKTSALSTVSYFLLEDYNIPCGRTLNLFRDLSP